MASLHVHRARIALLLRFDDAAVTAMARYSPRLLGETLAEAVARGVAERGLGYFPPLPRLVELGLAEPDLLAAVDDVTAFVLQAARNGGRQRLAALFSSVRVERVTSPAHTMPPMRPADPRAVEALAHHYAPDRARLELVVTSLERNAYEGAERWLGRRAARALAGLARDIRLLDAAPLEAGDG
ncbi:hypothetical protein [Inmirania thermothiophila]|uniref:Uncharacterized protein n=1 Tax=Inmirania thermothiophila TaxID=1750597 RepID=A0A3N1Y9V9_9GAMM|nr:hypothetical protein [Inmirania thermothiophila]ROR34412.1 hypothetical protein EDC57_0308 [Inmirania thermothiophila]